VREADRLVELSEDLLELGRAERGAARRPTRFDLVALVHDVAARLAAAAEKRGVELTTWPQPSSATGVFVVADEGELFQVVFNLLDNAIKYTCPGGRVTCEVAACPSGEAVTLVVADTGIGILAQDLPASLSGFGAPTAPARSVPKPPPPTRCTGRGAARRERAEPALA
jgi:signal transduction histidine kinase